MFSDIRWDLIKKNALEIFCVNGDDDREQVIKDVVSVLEFIVGKDVSYHSIVGPNGCGKSIVLRQLFSIASTLEESSVYLSDIRYQTKNEESDKFSPSDVFQSTAVTFAASPVAALSLSTIASQPNIFALNSAIKSSLVNREVVLSKKISPGVSLSELQGYVIQSIHSLKQSELHKGDLSAGLKFFDINPEVSLGKFLFNGNELSKLSAGYNFLIPIIFATSYSRGIVFIDEPELGLEPSLQRKLLRWMQMKIDQNGIKFVVCTHSSIFANPPERLVSRSALFSMADDISEPIIDFHAKGVSSFRMLGGRPSDIGLPDAVLIVEGASDAVYIEGVLDKIYSSSNHSIAVHYAGGDSVIPKASVAIEQMLQPIRGYMKLYDGLKFCMFDQPVNDKGWNFVRGAKGFIGDERKVLVLEKELEDEYILDVLTRAFSTEIDAVAVVDFIKETKVSTDKRGSIGGESISKLDLAKKYISEASNEELVENKALIEFIDSIYAVCTEKWPDLH